MQARKYLTWHPATFGSLALRPQIIGHSLDCFIKSCLLLCYKSAQSNVCYGGHLRAGRERAAAGRSRRLAARAHGRRAPSAGWPVLALPETAMSRHPRCPPSSRTPPAAFPTAHTSQSVTSTFSGRTGLATIAWPATNKKIHTMWWFIYNDDM